MNTETKGKKYNVKPTYPEVVFLYYLSKLDSSLVREYATPELLVGSGRSSIDLYSVDKDIAFEIDVTHIFHDRPSKERDDRKNEKLSNAGRHVVRFRNEKSIPLRRFKNVKIIKTPCDNTEKSYFNAVITANDYLEKIYGTKIDVDYKRDKEEVEALYNKLCSEYEESRQSTAKPKVIKNIEKSVTKSQSFNFHGKKVTKETLEILKRLEAKTPVNGLNGQIFTSYQEMAFTYNLDYVDFLIEYASGKKRLCALLHSKGIYKYRTELGFFKSLEDVAVVYGVKLSQLENLIEEGMPLDKAIEVASKIDFNKKYDLSINEVSMEERSTFIRTDLDGNIYSNVNILCKKHGISTKTYRKRLSSGLKKSQCLSKLTNV